MKHLATLRKSALRKATLIIAISIATVGAATIPVLPASASASADCSGNGCNGSDPYNSGCASSDYVVSSATIYKGSTNVVAGVVQLWYSTSCATNWAQVVIYNDGLNDIFSEYGQVNIADGRSISFTYPAYGSPLWTDEEYAPTVAAQACGRITAESFSTAKVCTGWF